MTPGLRPRDVSRVWDTNRVLRPGTFACHLKTTGHSATSRRDWRPCFELLLD